MPHQSLQNFRVHVAIKKVHGKTVPECMRSDGDAEPDTLAAAVSTARSSQLRTVRSVIPQTGMARRSPNSLSSSNRSRVLATDGASRRHSQDRTGAPRGCVGVSDGGTSLLGGADHNVRDLIIEEKVPSSQCQRFVQAGIGIPERINERVLAPVRQVVEYTRYFWRQERFRNFSVMTCHLAQRQCTLLIKGGFPGH